jgi:hypothetical protein
MTKRKCGTTGAFTDAARKSVPAQAHGFSPSSASVLQAICYDSGDVWTGKLSRADLFEPIFAPLSLRL